jgi:ABC-2 type transport system ATP-binding protein
LICVSKTANYSSSWAQWCGQDDVDQALRTLLQPTDGRVLVDGLDVTVDSLEARTRIGYLPENPFLYEGLSARQMLSFVGEVRALEASRLQRRIHELLGLLELEETADQLIRSYSHGMRKKVAIAAALLHDPHVILFDEPTSGLDPRSARVVKDCCWVCEIAAPPCSCRPISWGWRNACVTASGT